MNETSERYHWLDGIRGIAAVIVVLSHMATFGLYANEPYWGIAQSFPFRLPWTGHQAVIVFFVLSGFALFMVCDTIRPPTSRFLWSRFLRLYPPYIAAVLLAALTLKIPLWLGTDWPPKNVGIPNGQFKFDDLVNHVTMVGFFYVKRINPPIWSLVYEMRLTLLFPLIYLIVSRLNYRFLIVPALFTCAFSAMWVSPKITNELLNRPGLVDAFRTIHFAGMFFVGAYIAKHRIEIIQFTKSLTLGQKWFAFGVAFVVYLYTFEYTWTQWPRYIGELGTAASAFVFIALAIASTAAIPKALLWLGRISFSVYLTHHAVIHVAAIYGYGKLPTPILWIVTIGAILVVAQLFYKHVEAPAHRISRRALRPRTAARYVPA